MMYPLAEKFKAPQGEGLYTGTPFAFMRMVGCSVGQKICTSCDTDFSKMHEHLGGGMHSAEDLVKWARPYKHACLTGGEPLDRNLSDLVGHLLNHDLRVNIETSGTKHPEWLNAFHNKYVYVCVSPKPGYLDSMIERADELKVIIGGLGDGTGWPSLQDAIRWADNGKLVYIQPRNEVMFINKRAMDEAVGLVDMYPQLRLSAQLHKYLKTR